MLYTKVNRPGSSVSPFLLLVFSCDVGELCKQTRTRLLPTLWCISYTSYNLRQYKGFPFVTHEVGGRLQSYLVSLHSSEGGAVDITISRDAKPWGFHELIMNGIML